MVRLLLEMKAGLDTVLTEAFQRSETFGHALKDAFEHFINQRANRCVGLACMLACMRSLLPCGLLLMGCTACRPASGRVQLHPGCQGPGICDACACWARPVISLRGLETAGCQCCADALWKGAACILPCRCMG